ncbi:MAG: aldo/keto reductase [Gemmatimonadetes bacterium]|jgi:D-threo-aldose 1-dehydrogenase|nr:aldo/keto reductase [Gemmatimonadota bacterium]
MKPTDNRILGSSGLAVTRLGLGCAAIGGLYGDISDDQATQVVKKALDLGLNLFDTAPLYGLGKSEQRLGDGLKGTKRDDYVLASKVGRLLEPNDGQTNNSIFENEPPLKIKFDYSYDGVMRSLDASLERMGVDRIDIVHIHDPDNHWQEAIEGAYPALEKLRSEGTISAVSAGMNQWEMLSDFAREGDFDCFLLAGRYSLLDQSALHELLPLCVEKNIGIMAGGTYNSGILAKGARPGATYNYSEAPTDIVQKASAIEAIATRHNVNIKAAASQFVFAHPAITCIIPGTRQPERVEENFNLLTHTIPTDFWTELRTEKLIDPVAPLPKSH